MRHFVLGLEVLGDLRGFFLAVFAVKLLTAKHAKDHKGRKRTLQKAYTTASGLPELRPAVVNVSYGE